MYAKVSTVLGRNRIFTHHYIFVLLELAHKHFICDNFFLPKQSVEEHMTKWENGVLKCWTMRQDND